MERKETPSRLAVFEHVSPKGSVSPRNFSFNKKSADSTMTSDCEELVIDDEEVNENKEVCRENYLLFSKVFYYMLPLCQVIVPFKQIIRLDIFLSV